MPDNNPMYVGDEYVEDAEVAVEERVPEPEMYDLVLPPGVPHKMILETAEKFNLEITTRKCALKTIDVEPENLLVLRGDLEDVNSAHDYIYKKMSERYNYKK